MTTIAELAAQADRYRDFADPTPRKAKMPKSPPKPKKYHTFEITLRGSKGGDNVYGNHKTLFCVHTGGWKFARQLDDVIETPAEPAT